MKGRGGRTQSLLLGGGGGRGDSDGGGGTWFDWQLKMDTDALITFVKPLFSTSIT